MRAPQGTGTRHGKRNPAAAPVAAVEVSAPGDEPASTASPSETSLDGGDPRTVSGENGVRPPDMQDDSPDPADAGPAEDPAAEELSVLATAFDEAYYRRQYPGLPEGSALVHYIEAGWRLGYDPCPGFSTLFYLERSPDVRRANLNPFLHYLKWGRPEGRLPHPDMAARETSEPDEVADLIGGAFDVDYYLTEHPELVENNVDPIKHYVAFGAGMGWDPSPTFRTSFYLDRSPDVRAQGVNPFYHYLRWGKIEGRAPTPAALARGEGSGSAAAELIRPGFDRDFYLRAHPEVADCHVDPLLHFLHFGWRLGFDPSPDFVIDFYLDRSPDVRASGENPLHHYLRAGRSEGRLPAPPAMCGENYKSFNFLEGEPVERALLDNFDPRYYYECYPDIEASRLDPLKHYLMSGWREGRDPAPWFSTRTYLSRYPGVAAMAMNPLFHYVVWGRANGYDTSQRDDKITQAKRVPGARLVTGRDIAVLLHRARGVPDQAVQAEDPACLDIHWLVPDFEAGGGGHMTIFRMVKWLEFFGHRCTVWVQWPSYDRSDEEREELVLKHYQTVRARIRTLPPGADFEGADALIATGWDTAYTVVDAAGAKKKFYFVQDYEPYFHPVGARSLAAENTYRLSLICICASPWLERRMREHGSTAYGFRLAADEYYKPPARRPANAVPRIAVYARTHTSRRATELALLALQILAERGESFHADLFGCDTRFDEAPFAATNWGIVDAPTLARLYGEADIGICFSATNYSLVTQEMMACELPVIELDTESTRETYPEGVVLMAHPDPHDIADKISGLLHDEAACRALAERGASWVRTLSWEDAARDVETALLASLGGQPDRGASAAGAAAATAEAPPIKATVVIPTFNGGALFRQVLETVRAQRTPWPFEVIVIDSEPSDGTAQYAASLGDSRVQVVGIAKRDFQHGRTRNFGVSLARGEYVAFLTQDALPANDLWLYNLVVMLDRFPRAAGAFGRHIAWPDATPYTQRGIAAHFETFGREPLCVSKYTDIARWHAGDVHFRQFLHYYSDNNSCLRRSVWERLPLPDVAYGEDQLWADRIIRQGYAKVYAPHATVYHSHDYDEPQTFERAQTEAHFFREYFGYDLAPRDLRGDSRAMNAETERWGVQNGVSAEAIARQKRLNVVRLAGLAAGAVNDGPFVSAF